MKNGKSVLCVALKKGEKYVFEATDDVMYIDEIVSKLVPFDQCRPSWWDKAYKEGWNDAINHSKQETSMFVQVEKTEYWQVVYHNETKVMYTVSRGMYNSGNFTLLVNPDGTPMIYKG